MRPKNQVGAKKKKKTVKKSQNDILHVKTSTYMYVKIILSRSCKKFKISPKSDMHPFCGKPLNIIRRMSIESLEYNSTNILPPNCNKMVIFVE